MLIRPLFHKYQSFLLAFVNTKFGRSYLNLSQNRFKDIAPIVKITPDGVHCFRDNYKSNLLYTAVFYPHSPFLNKFALPLTAMAIAEENFKRFKFENIKGDLDLVIAHYLGFAKKAYLPQVMFAQATFNPDAHAETSSVDGTTRGGQSGDMSFDTLRDANGYDAWDNSGETEFAHLGSSTTSNKYDDLRRGHFLFNSASLPDNAVISDTSKISLYGTEKDNSLGSPDLHVAATNPASNIAIVAAAHQTVSRTSFGSVSYANFDDAGYNDIVLNASGRANISLTGVSKFSTQLSWDINDSFTGAWASATQTKFKGYYADNGSNKPTLTVDYYLRRVFITHQ